jgi:hypothetical protein
MLTRRTAPQFGQGVFRLRACLDDQAATIDRQGNLGVGGQAQPLQKGFGMAIITEPSTLRSIDISLFRE